MDPLELNTVHFLDALIYGVANDFVKGTSIVTVEVEPDFHKGSERLVMADGSDEIMIDLVFSGVHSVRIDDAVTRAREWADDEKPHDHEISTFKVRKLGPQYRAEIVCQLGQKIAIEFDSLTTVRSRRPAGVVHVYGESAAKSPP